MQYILLYSACQPSENFQIIKFLHAVSKLIFFQDVHLGAELKYLNHFPSSSHPNLSDWKLFLWFETDDRLVVTKQL